MIHKTETMNASEENLSKTSKRHEELERIERILRMPFKRQDVKFKPQAIYNGRALAVAYVTSRAVMERLDQAFGIDGWKTEFDVLLDRKLVVCKLSVRILGEWITRSDVGSESSSADEGNRLKSAFSDAIKRAAVQFGIGRYLYDLPMQWVEFDTKRRCFVKQPIIPDWACQ